MSEPWSEEEDAAVRQPDAVPICLRCFEPQIGHAWFCSKCGAAVGAYNNWMPYVSLFSIGEVFRSGVESKTQFTVVTVPGYLLVSISQMSFFAPIYWVRLFMHWRRMLRDRESGCSDDAKT